MSRNHRPAGHDCRGRLLDCSEHPRWHTLQLDDGRTRVLPPGKWWPAFIGREDFATHAEAINYATARARVEHLAAITNQEPCS